MKLADRDRWLRRFGKWLCKMQSTSRFDEPPYYSTMRYLTKEEIESMSYESRCGRERVIVTTGTGASANLSISEGYYRFHISKSGDTYESAALGEPPYHHKSWQQQKYREYEYECYLKSCRALHQKRMAKAEEERAERLRQSRILKLQSEMSNNDLSSQQFFDAIKFASILQEKHETGPAQNCA